MISLIPWTVYLGFVLGILATLLLQVTLIYFLFFRSGSDQTPLNESSADVYTFPEYLLEVITEKLGENSSEGTVLLNLLLEFWFHENRYDVNTLTSIGNRLNSELMELLTNTPLGRIFNSLKIHDIELGSESPTIRGVTLKNIDLDKDLKMLNDFIFEFDVNYVGGFYMSINAVMKFNSSMVFLSVKVVKCVGRVRVEFTRNPYTYWCISFLNPPDLELEVDSRLEGHSVPQLNRIIGIQLRRRINRKFVLPYYKIRAKPFLPSISASIPKDDLNESIPRGILNVTISSISRLPQYNGQIYCTLWTDNSAWVELEDVQTSSRAIMQLFKRSKDEGANVENRKLSAGSVLFEKHHDGLRQRLKSMTGYEENIGHLGEMIRRKSFTESSSLTRNTSADSIHSGGNLESAFANLQCTKRLSYSKVISFNDESSFDLDPSHRYLNILVWNGEESGNLDAVVGYVCLPLASIVAPGIGKKRRIFYLKPPNRLKNLVDAELCAHPGFAPSSCFGDVTIALKFISSNGSAGGTPLTLSPTKSPPTLMGKFQPSPILIETAVSLSVLDSEFTSGTHEFANYTITKQTNCGFCAKKIWLKEASRCVKCPFVCHKKCVVKCEKTCECRPVDFDVEIASQALSINPEIITTAPENNVATKSKLTTFLANVKGIRKSGSASNLSPGGTNTLVVTPSQSSPPTPRHSPSPSRKVSTQDIKLFESAEMEDEIEIALKHVSSLPQNEEFLQLIKDSGKKMCDNLTPEKREIRINQMMTNLQSEIDEETMKFADLEQRRRDGPGEEEAIEISAAKEKSIQRLQALNNLILHCCSALQNYQETLNLSGQSLE